MDFNNVVAQSGWSNNEVSIEEILNIYSFPQILKSTTKTSNEYNLNENSVFLFLRKQQLLRVVAQEIGKTCYVFGDPFEISSMFDGKFKLCSETERGEDIVKNFKFVSEVAKSSIHKFYLCESISVTLRNDFSDSFSTIDLFEGDEFTVNQQEEAEKPSKPASQKVSSYLNLSPSKYYTLSVHCTRLDTDMRLPYKLKASFASRPPRVLSYSNLLEEQTFSIKDFLQFGNFPLTVVLKSFGNSKSSASQGVRLHCGMRMKLIGLEIHTVFLAIDSSCHVVEFSANATFFIPSTLCNSSLEEEESLQINKYHDQIRKLISDLNLHEDTLIEASTRDHTRRHKSNIGRVFLNAIARLRQLNMDFYCVAPNNLNVSRSSFGDADETKNHDSPKHSCANRKSDVNEESMWGQFRPLATPNATPPEFDGRNCVSQSMPFSENPLPSTSEASFELDPSVTNIGAEAIFQPDSFSLINFPSDKKTSSSIRRPMSEMGFARAGNDVDGACLRRAMSAQVIGERDRTIPKEIYENKVDSSAPKQLRNHESRRDYDKVVLGRNSANSTQALYSYVRPAAKLRDKSRSRNEKCKIFVVGGKESDVNIQVHSSSNRRSSSEKSTGYASPTRQSLSEVNKLWSRSGNTDSENEFPVPRDPNETKPKVVDTPDGSVCDDANALPILQRCFKCGRKMMKEPSYAHPPTDWRPSGDVTSMSVTEVANSLRYIGMKEEIAIAFQNERIDGNLLLKLPDEILHRECRLNQLQLFKLKAFVDGWRPKLD